MNTARPTGQLDSRSVLIPGFGERRYRVYSPPESANSDEQRPLLLMFDGQNLFDDEGSYSGGWYAHRAVEKLSQKRLRPFVIGLDHGGETRIDELSPYTTRYGSGRAEALLEWMAYGWLPELRRELPLVDGPVGVLLGGSSMGGLASFFGHLRFPEAFGGALSMSPSFGLGGSRIFTLAERVPKPGISQIYLDCGVRDAEKGVQQMAKILRARGYGKDQLCVRFDNKGSHNEASWRRRLPAALRFFYR